MKITEKNLKQQLIRKNEDALHFVLENYGGAIKAAVSRILYLYPEDSEECIFDSIMKIWEKADLFDEKLTTFKNWAVSVAKYTALDRLKKIKKAVPIADIDELPVADTKNIFIDRDINEFFNELISDLNEEDKMIFTRLFIYEESFEEVAKKSNKSKAVIYNRVSRAKKKISKNIPVQFIKEEHKYE